MIIETRYSEYYLEYYLLFGILLEYYKKCYSFNPVLITKFQLVEQVYHCIVWIISYYIYHIINIGTLNEILKIILILHQSDSIIFEKNNDW